MQSPDRLQEFFGTFTSQASILEDPVIGSAHCSLIPFWARRLTKNELYELQVSERIGKLFCEYLGERVIISGQAKTYSTGYLKRLNKIFS